MSMAANKHDGIRAACCSDTFSARMTREHNDANMLCFGERVVGAGLALELCDAFLDATYLNNGNHVTRVAMLADIEKGTL
jgi:ribose 5-phosphate isomerase B